MIGIVLFLRGRGWRFSLPERFRGNELPSFYSAAGASFCLGVDFYRDRSGDCECYSISFASYITSNINFYILYGACRRRLLRKLEEVSCGAVSKTLVWRFTLHKSNLTGIGKSC